MKPEDYDKKLEELSNLEERLIKEIGAAGDIDLMELFISWQEVRAELNENSVSVWEDLLSRTKDIIGDNGNLTCRVLLRQLNKKYSRDCSKITISEKELFDWFEKGLHLRKYTEFDSI